MLDRYLRELASQDRRRSVAATFVLCAAGSRTVLAYYTLSAYALFPRELPPEMARRLPRYDRLPATLLGRLAVDRRWASRGWGTVMLFDALRRSFAQREQIGSVAVVVEAIDEPARAFYERFGFRRLEDHPMRLFLPMPTIAQLIRG